jgi:TetR/AcrR family transcriptional regulator, transcriptional repressor for nem operon
MSSWRENEPMISRTVKPSARDKMLAAAFGLIRARGYAATTVGDLCAAAGVTKGAFFHHFNSKEDLAVAGADHWSETTDAFRGRVLSPSC